MFNVEGKDKGEDRCIFSREIGLSPQTDDMPDRLCDYVNPCASIFIQCFDAVGLVNLTRKMPSPI